MIEHSPSQLFSILIRKTKNFSSKYFKKIRHFGFDHQCPFCKSWVKCFAPWGVQSSTLKLYGVVGAGYRPSVFCPICGSMDRSRLVWLFLERCCLHLKRNERWLHIAPESEVSKKLIEYSNIEYVAGVKVTNEKTSPRYNKNILPLDLTQLNIQSHSFNALICNHVLEHIVEEKKALHEIFRVLKPGGWALLQVPIALNLPKTFEDPSICTDEAREYNYGQSDHVRLHGLDYPDRLRSAGFQVELISPNNFLSTKEAKVFGVNLNETLYLAKKP